MDFERFGLAGKTGKQPRNKIQLLLYKLSKNIDMVLLRMRVIIKENIFFNPPVKQRTPARKRLLEPEKRKFVHELMAHT